MSIMSAELVSHSRIIEPARSQREPLTVDGVLEDSFWRQYFGALANHYSTLLHELSDDVPLVAELRPVVYLIDSDVIRTLVEERYEDSRLRREEVRLLESPLFRYAIPIGAFQELVEWLRSYLPNRLTWKEEYRLSTKLDRAESLRELGRAFALQVDDTSELDLIDRISSKIRTFRSVAERVIDFFDRPNFSGVVSDCELADVSSFHWAMGQTPPAETDGEGSPLRRDFREAVNLALVAKSRRANAVRQNSNPLSPSYVLITQTRSILDFVRNVRELEGKSLGTFSLLPISPIDLVGGLYPVFSPSRAFIVEDVRLRYDPTANSLGRLYRERRGYDALGKALRHAAQGERGVRHAAGLNLPDRLRSCLSHLIRVYSGSDSFYRPVEEDGGLEKSLRYIQRRREFLAPDAIKESIRLGKVNLEAEAETVLQSPNEGECHRRQPCSDRI